MLNIISILLVVIWVIGITLLSFGMLGHSLLILAGITSLSKVIIGKKYS